MIIGLGIDIVEHKRINERSIMRFLSDNEKNQYNILSNEQAKVNFLASR